MNARGLRRYLDDLLAGRRPRSFEPDDFEAEQIRTAIDLQAAREGADEPRPEFLAALHSTLAAQLGENDPGDDRRPPAATRRQVVVVTSAAAAAAVAAVAVDRLAVRGEHKPAEAKGGGELTPTDGRWTPVGNSADIADDGVMHPFDTASVIGFVRRVDGRPEAVSGVCTHQGCRLWFDTADTRLRCPCHSTSFSPEGQVLTHQLPIAPAPLPKLDVRENNGVIEVLAPAQPTEPG